MHAMWSEGDDSVESYKEYCNREQALAKDGQIRVIRKGIPVWEYPRCPTCGHEITGKEE